jgi:hypothetical protein
MANLNKNDVDSLIRVSLYLDVARETSRAGAKGLNAENAAWPV